MLVRTWVTSVFIISGLAAGCATSDDPAASASGVGTDDGSGSTTDTVTSTTDTASTSSTTTSSSSTTTSTSTTTSSTTEPESTTSSSSSSSDGSESTGCMLGTEDCPCDAGECDGGLECVEDVCAVIMVCNDTGVEPNETEAGASFLGDFDDDDDNGSSFNGVLNGADDVDWYRYSGSDSNFDVVDPFRSISSDGELRFCKFAECVDSDADTEFPCEGAATAATSPDGRIGCCADDIIHIPDANCTGTISDDMDIYLRIDQATSSCVRYTVNFHY